jgi:prepilin signal peptidase PulO-like enzyme (type II secretory pathway)
MVSAFAAGGAMLMTLSFSLIARAGLARCTNAGEMPAIAATICGTVLSSLALGDRDLTWPGAAMLSCASVCAATDLKLGFIFDRVLLASLTAIVATTWNLGRLTDGALAAIVCAGALLVPFVLSRGRGMGFGDVKFAGTAALALGLHASLHALWIACVSGGGVAALALATGRAHRRSRIPFGPFLALGACAALFAGGPG